MYNIKYIIEFLKLFLVSFLPAPQWFRINIRDKKAHYISLNKLIK